MLEETFLYREIHEQPDVLAKLIQREEKNSRLLAKAIRERSVTTVMIAARGTSDNAARFAQYLLGAKNRLPVALATPSLFSIYGTPPSLGNMLVLGISQSGKSPDIVSVLAEAGAQGALTAAITNEPESDLAKVAEFVIDLGAGPEKSVAATKTYTAELAAIALLSATLAGDRAMCAELRAVPQAVREVLAIEDMIAHTAPRYRYMKACVVIGRGFNYATAFEMALKMKELTYTQVEPYSSADFLHGPLALIEDGFPIFIISPAGIMLEEMKDFAAIARDRGAEVIAISDDDTMLTLSQIPIKLPATVPEWLSPITSIIPGQLLAMHLADARFYDVDQPRAIKKVTETL